MAQCDIAHGTPWDDLRDANLVLPSWFRTDLDPLSDEYAEQQHKLWSLLTGIERDYVPEIDEQDAPWGGVDAVRLPGFFVRRDPEALEWASHQVIATGMILKHSGLKPGQSALEYGAGFAQTALHLARLGIVVDTVDISNTFCRYVQEQADFFQVPLTPFEGRFGWYPRGVHKYDLIWFYECFHHCLDFKNVVHDLKRHLAPDGRVLLAGEPIPRVPNPSVPYPWGLRLHSEPVGVTRRFGWFELGFTEDFLVGLFTNAGFSADRIVCPETTCGEGYTFKHRGASIELATQWLPHDVEARWHDPEADGRWTKEESELLIDSTESFEKLVIEASNHLLFPQSVEITYGDVTCVVQFKKGERKEIVIKADTKAPRLIFRSRTFVPATDYKDYKSMDQRALGIFVHRLCYR